MTESGYHIFSIGKSKIRFHIQTLEVSRISDIGPAIRESASSKGQSDDNVDASRFGALVLNLTDACNLRCRYCFERHHSSAHPHRVMTPEMAKQGIDLFLSLAHTPESSITLFGGEPMLWWDHIPDLVHYGNAQARAQGTRLNWGISTNGTILPEGAIDFFVKNRISPMITIDGDRQIHDSLRPFAHGGGSYDTILANYLAFRERDSSYVTLRATVTPDHPHLFDVYQIFSDLCPDVIAIFPEYFNAGPAGWDEPALNTLLDEFYRLAEDALGQILDGSSDHPPPFPFSTIFPLLCVREQKRGYCGAYGQMIAIAPDGLLYPCMILDHHRSSGIGDLSQGLDPSAHARWKENCLVENRAGCRDCWARFLCGGGCIGHTVVMGGQNAPPAEFECRIIRHICEISIWMYREILEKRPDYFLYLVPGIRSLVRS